MASGRATTWCTLIAMAVVAGLARLPAEAAKYALYVESEAVPIAAVTASGVETLWGQLGDQTAKIDRVFVSVFSNGRTVFPPGDLIFPQMPEYAGEVDLLDAFLRDSHRRGVKVYAVLDCLHWQLGAEAIGGVLHKRPDLVEMNAVCLCVPEVDGLYASPLNPDVRQALVDLVEALGTRYPELDGLCLDLHLSRSELLGFSTVARAAAIRKIGLDPIDIGWPEQGTEVPDDVDTQAWFTFRLNTASEPVVALTDAFRRVCPHAGIMVSGVAERVTWRLREQASFLGDWANWARVCNAGIVLRAEAGSWQATEAMDGLKMARQILSEDARGSDLVVLVPIGDGMTNSGFRDELEAISDARVGEGAPAPQVGLVLDAPADVTQAAELMGRAME
jgi:hypothetical protein